MTKIEAQNTTTPQPLLGNEAIALALMDAGFFFVSGYPGTPASETVESCMSLIQEQHIDAQACWSINEKTAYESAYAVSLAGRRAAATMKQVGLNVAMDALMSSAYTGSHGALLLCAADDPGYHSSQTGQDSRDIGKMARIPVFDPADPQDAYEMVFKAAEWSERFETPVILRITLRVAHARMLVRPARQSLDASDKGFVRNPLRWAGVPREPRLRQGQELSSKIELMSEAVWKEHLESNPALKQSGKRLVIASGSAWALAEEMWQELSIDAVLVRILIPYPLPVRHLRDVFEQFEEIYCLEETYPMMREQLGLPPDSSLWPKGALAEDELTKARLFSTLQEADWGLDSENPYQATLPTEAITAHPPRLCPACPHRDIFFVIKKLFGETGLYPSDIGCYTLGLNMQAIDSYLCMGASVAKASGFSIARPERPVIATIGDSTFLHSGVAPLIDAVAAKRKFMLVILDNGVVAMTGGQPTPERSGRVDIVSIVRGCGVEPLVYPFEHDLQKTTAFFQQAGETMAQSEGPTVVVVREYCVLETKPHRSGSSVVIDSSRCTPMTCGICVTDYQCPAMIWGEESVVIEPTLCTTCGSCTTGLCPTNAFIWEPSNHHAD